jgi:hypothetical protein
MLQLSNCYGWQPQIHTSGVNISNLKNKNIYWHTPNAISIFGLKVYIWQGWHYNTLHGYPELLLSFLHELISFSFEQGTMPTAKITYEYSGHILMNTKHQDTNIFCWDIRNQYKHDYSDGSSMQKFNNSKFVKVSQQCLSISQDCIQGTIEILFTPNFLIPIVDILWYIPVLY